MFSAVQQFIASHLRCSSGSVSVLILPSFIAIAIAYDLGLNREHMVQPKVNKDDIDEMP